MDYKKRLLTTASTGSCPWRATPGYAGVKIQDTMETSELVDNDLTEDEQSLFENLPGPPVTAVVRSTNIWIIEWLPENDQRTGKLLHEWIQVKRPGLSIYSKCEHKNEVLASIERATKKAEKYGMLPILHLEAHGNEMCLGLPNDNGNVEVLTWDELIEPLQRLNLATHCNLIIVVAACIGFSGIKAFVRGPLAPAVVLIGPSAPIMSNNLFSWTKEFYKLRMGGNDNFSAIAANATHKAGSVSFSWEPFAVLAYDALAKQVIISMRPGEQKKQLNRFRQRMIEENNLSAKEIEERLSHISYSLQVDITQQIWDKMFMIDLYPDNREKFGVNWFREFEMISNSKCLTKST